MARAFKYSVLLGLGYGVVLSMVGILVAGFGHGPYTLLGLAGAPFSLLGIPDAILATVCQWGFLALAIEKIHLPKPYFICFLIAHYVIAAALLLLPSSNFADWDYVHRIPYLYQLLLVFGFVWYLVGQVLIWKVLIRGQRVQVMDK